MRSELKVAIGQYSDRGVKPLNQDFHGVVEPTGSVLEVKGITVALADGISSSEVSQIASETAVSSFLGDYYSTSESWSVKNAVLRVLQATNSWLFSQNRNSAYRRDLDKGYVCTFSALVLKSTTAHIFHVGDTRVYRVEGSSLEPLTEDHRLWVSSEKSHLSRALGIRDYLDIDYQSLQCEIGDVFVLATDGVYEFVAESFVTLTIHHHQDDLDQAAKIIVEAAIEQGSDDNLTIQIVRIDELPLRNMNEAQEQAQYLPFPPELRPRMTFDGYNIQRILHRSSRSKVYLAQDIETDETVVLKVPAVTMQDDPGFLDSFVLEEWVARKLDSPHLLKAPKLTRSRHYLYSVMEYVDGQTLAQWMIDNPKPDLETVRNLVGQIAKGLQVMHRQEMLHQDVRPANVLIDHSGTVKLIDFGSAYVAGMVEAGAGSEASTFPGTVQYSAPEYFIGEPVSSASDLFSLGVIAHQLLSGRLPYGTGISKCQSRSQLIKLSYSSVLESRQEIPVWVDETIKKAVHLDAHKRYHELSEFTYDLRHPNKAYTRKLQVPLMARDPVRFWQGISLSLLLIVIYLLAKPHF